MQFSEDRSEIFKAMFLLKSKLVQPEFDKEVDYTAKGRTIKFAYASLAAIEKSIRTASQAAACGIDFEQEVATDGDQINITTLITHESGQYIIHGPLAFSNNDNPQGMGSVMTYGKRYALSAAFGIAADSDDEEKLDKDQEKPQQTRNTNHAPSSTSNPNNGLSEGQIKLGKNKIKEYMDLTGKTAGELRQLIIVELSFELDEVANMAEHNFQKLMNFLNQEISEAKRSQPTQESPQNNMPNWGTR